MFEVTGVTQELIVLLQLRELQLPPGAALPQ